MEATEQSASIEAVASGDVFKPRGFVKWAGSKRQLAREIKAHIPSSWDLSRDLYCEPFVGSGALFWELLPSQAWLNDSNSDLVNVWKVIVARVEELIGELSDLEVAYRKDPEVAYHSVRSWNPSGEVGMAARFIFLNKTCFNGLHRVNRRGEFNVGWGKNPRAAILNVENLKACSNVLAQTGVKLSSHDFSDVKPIPKGSLVYVDPPYAPVSKTSNFASFTATKFGHLDHVRLVNWCSALVKRGVHVVVSQSAAVEVVDLYRAEGFAAHPVTATRRINCEASGRGQVGEYILVGGGM